MTGDVAQGPRLPRYWAAWLFVLAGAATLWLSVLEVIDTIGTPETLLSFVLDLLPPLCGVLLPAALLFRHPDVARHSRALLFGTLLFAAVPFLTAIEGSLQETFKTLTPAPEDLDWLIPMSVAYRGLVTLVGVFGALYVALGLARQRDYAFTRAARLAGYVIWIIAAAVAVARVWAVSQLDLTGVEMTPIVAIYIGSSMVLGILTVLAWSVLATVLVRGAISGEEPTLGWVVGSIGGAFVMATFAIVAWTSLVQTPNETLRTVVNYLSGATYALGYLGVLIGFALGMPSFDRVDWGDEADPDPSGP